MRIGNLLVLEDALCHALRVLRVVERFRMDYSFGLLPQYSVLAAHLFVENVAYPRLPPPRVLQEDRVGDLIFAFFISIVIISGEAI